MRRCATFWNGVGCLLLPCRADGRMPSWLDGLLEVRPVDACFMHEALGDTACAAIKRRIPEAIRLWSDFDAHEVHPLDLETAAQRLERDAVLEVPHFATERLRRVALAVWGDVPEVDLPHWQDRFSYSVRDGVDAHGALLRAQVDLHGESPLRLTARHMILVWQEAPMHWPYIWVFGDPTFDALVNFWNLRARSTGTTGGPSVIGVPRESLRHPEQLGALAGWLRGNPSLELTPDVFVSCPAGAQDEVRSALASLSINEETDTQAQFTLRARAPLVPHKTPTFRFAYPGVGGRFIRGAHGYALVAFTDGRSSLSLPAPPGFDLRTTKRARLTLSNLPMPLPVTPAAAQRVHRDGQARDGVTLLTAAVGEWNIDIQLPRAAQALQDWASDHGYILERSSAGRDTEALLRRTGALDGLDVFADAQRLAVLRALAPPSRVKLARGFVAEVEAVGGHLDEQTMLEKLSDLGLFLELHARSAGDIASSMEKGVSKRHVLRLLEPLVAAGFVRRARQPQCPQCRFRTLLDLAEQDERVRCRACGATFVLPVVDQSGEDEPALLYRLDGVMARAMDQDLLPAVLALRALRPPAPQPNLFFAWPGVLLARDGGRPVDVDLLISDGRTVWFYEVKNNAGGLEKQQLQRLIRLASEAGARPGLAALEGSFAPELVQDVMGRGGRVLERKQLLA